MTPDRSTSDSMLWKAYQNGQPNALGFLLQRHQGRILTALYSIIHKNIDASPSLEDIKDAIQEMAHRMLEDQEKHTKINLQDFPSWAIQYTLNIWRNARSKRHNRQRILREKLIPDTPSSYEMDLLIHIQYDRQAYIDAIQLMKNNTYRQLIFLLLFEQYDSAELAEHFKQSSNWVYDKKYRALKAYREVLRRSGLISGVGYDHRP